MGRYKNSADDQETTALAPYNYIHTIYLVTNKCCPVGCPSDVIGETETLSRHDVLNRTHRYRSTSESSHMASSLIKNITAGAYPRPNATTHPHRDLG